MDWKRRRVLVTGASGFIGSHLTKSLVNEGAEVHVWVRSSTNPWRLAEIQDRLSLHTVDLRDEVAVKNSCQEIQPEIVYHLAAYGVDYEQRDITQALDINVRGTVNLICGLKGTACSKLIHTGTWAEYGQKNHAIRETDSLEPVGIYGCTKAAATLIAYGIAGQYEVPLLVIRPFSVYGPCEGEHKFVPYVILSLLDGEAPRLTTCRQIRDYSYVEDVVEACLKAADVSVDKPLILNVASGVPITLQDLVYHIVKLFNDGKAIFGVVPQREKEIWQVYADVSAVKKVLGWQAKTPLEVGLGRTVHWFKQHKRIKTRRC